MKRSRKIVILLPPLLIGLTMLHVMFVYQYKQHQARTAHVDSVITTSTTTDVVVTMPLPDPIPPEEPVASNEEFCTVQPSDITACAEIYTPVCAQVQVECVTTPCEPVSETFSNACTACANHRTVSYVEGACEATL